MNLLVVLLLVITFLAATARIADSRRVSGFLMLAVVMFLFLGVSARQRQRHLHSAHRAEPVTALAAAVSVESDPVADAEDAVTADGEAEGDQTGSDDSEDSDDSDETASEDPSDVSTDDITVETGEVIIPPRPGWVEAEDVRTGDLHTTAVSSGPHETERECRRALDRELERAVRDYIDWYLGHVYEDRFRASTFVRYDLDEIKRRLVPSGKIYHEVIRVSFGPMHQAHAQLAFDPSFRRELDSRRSELDRHWQQWIVRGRLLGTALGFGLVLTVMGVFFGYFRLDTATRGFYTAGLRWTAAAAILVLMAVGVVLAGRILQM